MSYVNDYEALQELESHNRKQFEAMMAHHRAMMAPTRKPEPEVVDWDLTFSFVPEHLIMCNELFNGRDKQRPFTPDIREIFTEYNSLISSLNITNEFYNNLAVEKAMLYWELAKLPFVHTICESGFHDGATALIFLGAKSTSQLYSFGVKENKISHQIVQFVQDKYFGRLQVTWGESPRTLPMFVYKNKDVKCDLVILDGVPSYDSFVSDFNNFRKLANFNNVIVFNNYPLHHSSWGFWRKEANIWDSKKKNAQVSEAFRCYYDLNNKEESIAVGRVNRNGNGK